MSNGLLRETTRRGNHRTPNRASAKQFGVVHQIARMGRAVGVAVVSPLRLMLSIRRSMTSASTILLLVGVATTNIIWGYPWVGVFSASMSLFFVGWTLNRLSTPRLEIDYSLPRSAPAGQAFPLQVYIANRSRLPAMDLDVGFDDVEPGSSKRAARRPAKWSPFASIDMLRTDQRTGIATTMRFENRGTHRMPALIASTVFPFHLFQSKRSYSSGVDITITPKPLGSDDGDAANTLLDVAGNWSRWLLSSDALDYTGSREYQYGMPVRRWDFTSWARLGRPIVREFQSPSVRTVTMIIDTSADLAATKSAFDIDPMAERVLSLAAAVLHQLCRQNVRIRMFVTSESGSAIDNRVVAFEDLESLLIRLGAASYVARSQGVSQIETVTQRLGREPMLILSGQAIGEFKHGLPANAKLLRVDLPTDDPSSEHRTRGNRKRRSTPQRFKSTTVRSEP